MIFIVRICILLRVTCFVPDCICGKFYVMRKSNFLRIFGKDGICITAKPLSARHIKDYVLFKYIFLKNLNC